MVYVSSFSIKGLKLIFHSADHFPPHFHVRKGIDWEIRVFIDTSTTENGLDYNYKFPKIFRGLSKTEERELLVKLIEYKEELLKEWQEKVYSREPI